MMYWRICKNSRKNILKVYNSKCNHSVTIFKQVFDEKHSRELSLLNHSENESRNATEIAVVLNSDSLCVIDDDDDKNILRLVTDQFTEGVVTINSKCDDDLLDKCDNNNQLKTIVGKNVCQSHSEEIKGEVQRKVQEQENITNSSEFDEVKSKGLNKKQLSFGKSNKKVIQNNKEYFKSQFTKLTKTPSGSVAMEFDKDTIKQIEKQLKRNREVHATIMKTESGHHVVDFNTCDCSDRDIFVFKKSLSGCLLMEINKNNATKDETISKGQNLNNSVSPEVKLDNLDQNKAKQSDTGNNENSNKILKHNGEQKPKTTKKYQDNQQNIKTKNTLISHKLLIKDSKQELECPLAVLLETESSNYILNVDKEYEKPFKETLNKHFGFDFECPIELLKRVSGSIVVDFLENNDTTVPNARIARSKSGNIIIRTDLKIISNQPNNTKSCSFQGKRASEIFSKIMNRLQVLKTESAEARYFNDKKSSSDSKLLQKVQMKLQNQQNLLSESSALLKRTASGQYTVVLNKDSKKIFIDNLKHYVFNNSHEKIPIKTENGEIIILLNNDTNENSHYDSLKITSSGNIFVIVDERCLKNVPNTKENKTNEINKDAVQKVESKNVTTTCNAVTDSCDSCNPNKCVCREVLSHDLDNIRFNIDKTKCVKSFKFCSIEDSDYDCKKFKCRYKINNKYPEGFIKKRDKSPHSVIRQCSCGPESKNETTDNEQQLFDISQSVFPFHKNMFETSSIELLENSSINYQTNKSDKVYNNNCQTPSADCKSCFEHKDSDYLKFLPPQLPSFLCGYRNT